MALHRTSEFELLYLVFGVMFKNRNKRERERERERERGRRKVLHDLRYLVAE